MTTVATFTKSEDAHLLRMRLEEAGIEAFTQDQNLNITCPGLVGGVRVDVADEDVPAARKYLAEDIGI